MFCDWSQDFNCLPGGIVLFDILNDRKTTRTKRVFHVYEPGYSKKFYLSQTTNRKLFVIASTSYNQELTASLDLRIQ